MKIANSPKYPISGLVLLTVLCMGCPKSDDPPAIPVPQVTPSPPQSILAESSPLGQTMTRRSGLKYETLKEGTGPMARPDDLVTVHYTGTLEDGKVFDSSRQDDRPMTFKIGDRRLLQGWNEGIAGMKAGERRKLILPPNVAYGALGQLPKIPPNATLFFDVELIKIETNGVAEKTENREPKGTPKEHDK
jgi:hypothetical protein